MRGRAISDSERRYRRALARRIRQRMVVRDLNQPDVARRMGVTKATVSDWLNAEILAQPEMHRIPRLARVLRCDLGWLVSGVGYPD